ncbi:helix-turn-helix domain-containing protein [Macrococcus armenti]|uniref:helix-turn-helix domain-containing protein n=1 Tax=Macrococcus armenti TaxID=2875764 RepID=UPI001CD2DB26|nr:helix-turn-helix transcriptional regulator [Macrococcus armenti]UBH11492.1 helix-turn-helix transcriptional regulator [Macrococcus armenti]
MSIIIPNLRVKMAEKGWNIKDVHEKTGISRTTISNMFNYYVDGIKFDTLGELCDVFNCEIEDLLKKMNVDVIEYNLKFEKQSIPDKNGSYTKVFHLNVKYLIDEIEAISENSVKAVIYCDGNGISGDLALWYVDDILLNSKNRYNEQIEKKIIKYLDKLLLKKLKEDKEILKHVDIIMELFYFEFDED